MKNSDGDRCESRGSSLGDSGCLWFRRTNGKTTGVHRCPDPRGTQTQSSLWHWILSWDLPLLCAAPITQSRQGLGNYAFCWLYVIGTRRLCVTHPGLAGFRTQSSDIFRLFISQRTLQPTYRCCIIIKNYSGVKCSWVTAADRTETCWVGSPVWGPQSHNVLSWNKKTFSGREGVVLWKTESISLYLIWGLEMEVVNFGNSVFHRQKPEPGTTEVQIFYALYHSTFVLVHFLELWQKTLKTKRAHVLVIRSTSKTGSSGNYLLLLSQHGWWCHSLHGEESRLNTWVCSKEGQGELWVRYTVGRGSWRETGLSWTAASLMWTRWLMAALSVIENWKRPKCPSMEGC